MGFPTTTEPLSLSPEQTANPTLNPTTTTTTSVARGNGSSSFLDSEFRYTLFPAFYGVVFVLGLLANAYVLFVLRRLRRAKSMREISVYMTNLTVADLLFVCALPFWIGYYSRRGEWVYSDFLCRLTGSLFFINTYSSVLFLTAISLNRYWAVTRPFAAVSSDHWRRGVGVSAAIWAATLAMAAPYLAWPGVKADGRCFEGYQEESDSEKRGVAVTHFVIVALFALIFAAVVACNLLIARALLARSPVAAVGAGSASGRSRGGTSVRPASARPRGVKRQALQMLCAVVGVFVVCFLPHHVVQAPWTLAVLQIREGWGATGWGAETRQALNDLHQVTLLLMGLNCILDPVVYCFATRKFRRYVRGHLRRMGKGEGCSRGGGYGEHAPGHGQQGGAESEAG